MVNKHKKTKNDFKKKHVKGIKTFLKKKKRKKYEYHRDRNKNLSEEQKQKNVGYMRNQYLVYNK